MDQITFESWLNSNHLRFQHLTEAVLALTISLLADRRIAYLSIDGRTKTKKSCIDKIHRKNYNRPETQMTDISGIRIICYFEKDVAKVSQLIEDTFSLDVPNSMNRSDLLATNELGYRSVHYVCDLGEGRYKLPEYAPYKNMKFEFQVRTVLQHAWAELSHDRSYKFSGSLPKQIQRRIFLLAGMLEMVDSGFSELTNDVETYVDALNKSSEEETENIDINNISLKQFMTKWTSENGLDKVVSAVDRLDVVIGELAKIGVVTLGQLRNIIPDNFAAMPLNDGASILGVIRDWMIITKTSDYIKKAKPTWKLGTADLELYRRYLDAEKIDFLVQKMDLHRTE